MLGEYAKKKIRKKSGLLPNPPRRTPRFGLFSVKKFDPHFFVGKCIYNSRNKFYTKKILKLHFFSNFSYQLPHAVFLHSFLTKSKKKQFIFTPPLIKEIYLVLKWDQA